MTLSLTRIAVICLAAGLVCVVEGVSTTVVIILAIVAAVLALIDGSPLVSRPR